MRDFTGFRFGNTHSEDLHLVVVSSGSRYEKNLLPDPQDSTVEVPGGDGEYYFGQVFKNRSFTVNVAFDSVSEKDFRRISQIFANDKPQDLVFDEMPFKTYRAKLSNKPDFKFICFTDRDTGERVYKGEGTLNFICYYPYAYCFNKYVVRAADYYKCLQPKEIIERSIQVNPYEKRKPPKLLPGLIKNHYNVEPNMHTPWKGGYPAKEQVQWGELYFNDPKEGRKKIIDVRGYWDNIPEWQGTAKLLVTPTLDFDRELIYCPQYSKINYYNMDTGLNQENALIGSRILVYNPGDLPIDFEIRLGNLTSKFRKNTDNYTFRISRYNVQRLTIPEAVDFTGLTTYREEDNIPYKYGNRYFTIIGAPEDGEVIPTYENLKFAHPHHTYIVEPIPKEKLGYFIRLFYWQSSLLEDDIIQNVINFEDGKKYADRYEEMYEECINDHERYELYWHTLKEAILDRFKDLDEYLKIGVDHYEQIPKMNSGLGIFTDDFTYEDFIYDYIYNPPEYTRAKLDLKYGQFLFNISRYPQYYTFDYFDINSKDFDKIPQCCCGCDECHCNDKLNRSTIKPLYLDTEKRMLYNINNPKWRDPRTQEGRDLFEDNPKLKDNFFNFKPTKRLFNENILRGHWFKLPPGWSMIDISPIIDEDKWGGKQWLDAKAFNWGSTDKECREKFNQVYRAAATEYLSHHIPMKVIDRYSTVTSPNEPQDAPERKYSSNLRSVELRQEYFNSLDLYQLEDYMQFRRWREDEDGYEVFGTLTEMFTNDLIDNDGTNMKRKDSALGIIYEVWRHRIESDEYGFLKTLAEYWRANRTDSNCNCVGDIDEWWWYASNYIWANFPPLYWGYADLINKAQIKYVPLFY